MTIEDELTVQALAMLQQAIENLITVIQAAHDPQDMLRLREALRPSQGIAGPMRMLEHIEAMALIHYHDLERQTRAET